MEGGTAVEGPRKGAPEEVLMSWGEGIGQGRQDSRGWHKLLPSQGFQLLPPAWWWNAPLPRDLPQQKDELRDYEKLCATSEAYVCTLR